MKSPSRKRFAHWHLFDDDLIRERDVEHVVALARERSIDERIATALFRRLAVARLYSIKRDPVLALTNFWIQDARALRPAKHRLALSRLPIARQRRQAHGGDFVAPV